jgi:hypothetical protein
MRYDWTKADWTLPPLDVMEQIGCSLPMVYVKMRQLGIPATRMMSAAQKRKLESRFTRIDQKTYGVHICGKVVLIDASDYESLKHAPLKMDGNGYTCTSTNGRRVKLHRMLMGAGASELVDHRSGDRLDCRRANLRICNAKQNCRNRRVMPKRTAGGILAHFKGVYAESPRSDGSRLFRAQIVHPSGIGSQSIGGFTTAEEAARAYDRVAIERFGEFARTNFPVTDYVSSTAA